VMSGFQGQGAFLCRNVKRVSPQVVGSDLKHEVIQVKVVG